MLTIGLILICIGIAGVFGSMMFAMANMASLMGGATSYGTKTANAFDESPIREMKSQASVGMDRHFRALMMHLTFGFVIMIGLGFCIAWAIQTYA